MTAHKPDFVVTWMCAGNETCATELFTI